MTDSLETDLEDLLALAAQTNIEFTNGCCAFDVAGVELVADPSGVIWWGDEQCLIVSDLHLEKGSSFARRGQLIPPYDTKATLARLSQAMDEWQPKRVISLGDSFHDNEASTRLSLNDRRQLQSLATGRDWIWITGNHDPEPPSNLAGEVVETLAIGPLHFCHEPQIDAASGQISGHLHPKARIRRQSRSISRRCFAASQDRLILPGFGTYTGGLNVLDRAYDGLFQGRSFLAMMIGDGQVYRIAGRELRK